MSAYTLREYQERCSNAFIVALKDRKFGNACGTIPGGGGKSLIIADVFKKVNRIHSGARILSLVHSTKLVEQNRDKWFKHNPEARDITGTACSTLGRKEFGKQITFGSIQSCTSYAKQIVKEGGPINYIKVDEMHRIARSEESSYRALFNDLKGYNANLRISGVSMNDFRSDGPICGPGDDFFFDTSVCNVTVKYLLNEGYLTPIFNQPSKNKPDMSGVPVANTKDGWEFNGVEVENKVTDPRLIKAQVNDIVTHGKDRKRNLIFCAGIYHAEKVVEELKSRGENAAVVSSDNLEFINDQHLLDFHNGTIKHIATVDKLGEGFDEPLIDMLTLLRPTFSALVYSQQIARAMRVEPAECICGYESFDFRPCPTCGPNFAIERWKNDVLVLDCVGNIGRHGPLDKLKPPKLDLSEEKDDQESTVMCDHCGSDVSRKFKECPYCLAVLPIKRIERESFSGLKRGDLISEPQWHEVLNVRYKKHPKGLAVTYECVGGSPVKIITGNDLDEWIRNTPFEDLDNINISFPVKPETFISQGVQHVLKKPVKIFAETDGPAWIILNIEYDFQNQSAKNAVKTGKNGRVSDC